ncbi:hypothetical protein HY489_05490 [Candidatus Woesearchaeota archaeon]|nr:hypothetical protein [Candidatus Woesearchaeota archaeon]
MTKKSELLVAYGFVKEDKPLKVSNRTIKIEGKKPEEKLRFIREKRDELARESGDLANEFDKELESLADHELDEIATNQMLVSDYPKPISTYRASMESWHDSIEKYYYWCLNFLGDVGFGVVDKVTDTFSAAESSSFYGAQGQRLGLAQDKVGQYLATIGKMVKDLFQLVRELRWIDERVEIYRDAFGHDKNEKKVKEPIVGAEIALKGMWVDLVDGVVGGQRTGSNLFNMASQLQFTALPDLFFSIHPLKREEVDKTVEDQAGSFNQQVKNVLKRKLEQYLAWKETTYKEIISRRRFTLDYLYQHYQAIKLYINWIKPYLRHIERLTGQTELLNNPRLVSAFESNLIEIEVIGRILPKGNSKTFACIMLTFEYHTKPQMQYPGDSGYHRGPIHVGTTRITWRSYAWTAEQIKNYISMRGQEDLELITRIENNLKSAMDTLGNDVQNYLKEAEERGKPPKEEKEEKQKIELMEPFTALMDGLKEAFGALIPDISLGGKKAVGGSDRKAAVSTAKTMCFLHYDVFKKAHQLLSW